MADEGGETRNTIDGGTQYGPVLQGRDFSNITFVANQTTLATGVGGWLQQAIKAAKNQRQQRFAHIIGNSGVMVAGLRSIDREVYRLFLPLNYFNPQSWPEEKRREWAERILALANEDVILPRMRAADRALATLAAEESEPQIAELIKRFRSIDRDNHLYPAVEQDSVGSLLLAANVRSYELAKESLINYVELESNLRGKLVTLLGLNLEDLDINSALGRFIFASGDWVYFRAMSDAAEYIFGLLMNWQWPVFPDLPVPTWVWDS